MEIANIKELPLISVIVPVYNAEKSVRRTLDSILSQTYVNLDIIIVDDGSTDRSCQLCMEVSHLDPRVRVLRKENGGLSAARNHGLEHARGKYIAFCDADDRMTPDSIMALVNCMDDDVQLAVIGASFEFPEGRTAVWKQFEDKTYSRSDDCGTWLRYGTVWGKLFVREVIEENRLRFTEKVCTEDCVFYWEYLEHVTKVRTSSVIGYYYYKGGNCTSTSSRVRPPLWWEKNFDCLVAEYERSVSSFHASENDVKAIRSFVSETIFNSLSASYVYDVRRSDRKRIYEKARNAVSDYQAGSRKQKVLAASVRYLPFAIFDCLVSLGRHLR